MAIFHAVTGAWNPQTLGDVGINRPAEVLDGDLVVCIVTGHSATGYSPPTGFTLAGAKQVGATQTLMICWKIAAAGETAWFPTNGSTDTIAHWYFFRGARFTAPVSVTYTTTGIAAAGATPITMTLAAGTQPAIGGINIAVAAMDKTVNAATTINNLSINNPGRQTGKDSSNSLRTSLATSWAYNTGSGATDVPVATGNFGSGTANWIGAVISIEPDATIGTFGQIVQQQTATGSAVTSLAATFTTTPTPGNLLLVTVSTNFGSNAPTSVTAGAGRTFLSHGSLSTPNPSSLSVWARPVTSGDSNTITALLTGSSISAMTIMEIAGPFICETTGTSADVLDYVATASPATLTANCFIDGSVGSTKNPAQIDTFWYAAAISDVADTNSFWRFGQPPLEDWVVMGSHDLSGPTSTRFSSSITRSSRVGLGASYLEVQYQNSVTYSGRRGILALFKLTNATKPTITVQPASQSKHAGETVTFTVDATFDSFLNFQWQSSPDGSTWSDIVGEVTSSYSRTVNSGVVGVSYRCVLTDALGVANSAAATVTILPVAITSQPVSQIVNIGANVTFTVAVDLATYATFQWQVNTGSWADIPGETGTSYTRSVASDITGKQYRVAITDPGATIFSNAVTATVAFDVSGTGLKVRALPLLGGPFGAGAFSQGVWKGAVGAAGSAALAATPASVATLTAALTTTPAAGAALAATPASVGTLTADLTNAIRFAATPAAVGTLTAGLTNAIRFAATPAAVGTLTAGLTNAIRLAATPASVGTLTADLTAAIRFAATPASVGTLTGALTTQIKLAATPAAVGTLTADLTAPGAVTAWAATPAAEATLTGALTTQIKLAATPAAVGTLTGDLSAQIKLASTPASVGTLTAALTTQIKLAATPASVGTATGALTTAIQLAATPAAVGTLTAALTTQIKLAATPAAVSTLTASLLSPVNLDATPAAVATLTGALTTQIKLAATPAAVGTLTAALTTQIKLASTPASVGTLGADLSAQIKLAAAPAGASTLTAALTTSIKLAAQAIAQATATSALTTQIKLAASPAAVATATADMAGLAAQLAAQAIAQASATAALTTQIRLAASASANAALIADLSARAGFSVYAQAVATLTASLATASASLNTRIYTVAAQDRTLAIGAQDRTLAIGAQDRTLAIGAVVATVTA